MMKSLSLVFGIMLLSIACSAQVQYPSAKETPAIEVVGSAEKEVVPDEIYVTIVLREKNRNNDKWKIEVLEENLLNELKKNGFDLQNLSLAGADGDMQYRVFRKSQVITQKRLLMKTKDAGEVNKLFQILDALEIEDAFISKTSHSQLEQFRRDVKIGAMKAAKEKADYLLNSIGHLTGMPLYIHEQSFTPYQGNLYGSNAALSEVVVTGYASKSRPAGFENEIAFAKIKIRFEITAKFEIK
jgi:uncharacterized protein YggE